MTNGEMMKTAFPNVEVEHYVIVSSDIHLVDVMFNDSYCGCVTFSREWWDREYENKNKWYEFEGGAK